MRIIEPLLLFILLKTASVQSEIILNKVLLKIGFKLAATDRFVAIRNKIVDSSTAFSDFNIVMLQ